MPEAGVFGLVAGVDLAEDLVMDRENAPSWPMRRCLWNAGRTIIMRRLLREDEQRDAGRGKQAAVSPKIVLPLAPL